MDDDLLAPARVIPDVVDPRDLEPPLPPPDAATARRHAQVRAEPAEAWRDEPVDRKRALARRRGAEVPDDATEGEVDVALERVLGTPDFLPGNWCALGARRADAVARLDLGVRGTGTGFLVSPWLMLTNHHVLRTPAHAVRARVHFRFRYDVDGGMENALAAQLDPDRCFVTGSEEALDFTLVAVAPLAGGQAPGDVLGWVPLRGGTGHTAIGAAVNILQHPGGRLLEIACRNNLLVSVDDARHLTYETDTEGGSSGAPVFDDGWDLVALHATAVSATDASGRDVDVDGRLVTSATPESRRRWVANRGERISALVEELRARPLDDAGTEAAALVAQALPEGDDR